MPKCFHSFFLPGHRTQYLLAKGKEDVIRAGRAGLNGERARAPRPPRGFSAALPTLPHLLRRRRTDVGEGWQRRRAAEADALRQFPSNTHPAPSRGARGAGAGKGGWGEEKWATVAMAARLPRPTPVVPWGSSGSGPCVGCGTASLPGSCSGPD